jgi:hypothetical protein
MAMIKTAAWMRLHLARHNAPVKSAQVNRLPISSPLQPTENGGAVMKRVSGIAITMLLLIAGLITTALTFDRRACNPLLVTYCFESCL